MSFHIYCMQMASFQCGFFCASNLSCVLSHILHGSGSSSVCVLSCFFKYQLRLNVYLHVMYANNFSPVWALLCFLKPQYCFNVFPHLCMLMASLLCGSFCASSNLNCVQMSYHMFCIVMALLLCKSLYASSNISCF